MNTNLAKSIKKAEAKIKSMKMVKMPKMPKFPKVKKENALIAGAIAGVTLLFSAAGYAVYALTHRAKKVNLKNIKIEVVKNFKSAEKKVMPLAKKAGRMMKKR